MLMRVPAANTNASVDTYVGTQNQLFYDSEGSTIFRSDGVTPGGIAMGGSTGGGTTNTIQQIRIPLTSAQILNSSANPVLLLAAPGAGKMTMVESVYYSLTFGTVAYNSTGGPGGVWYGGSISVDNGDNNIFDNSSSQVQVSYSWSGENNQSFDTSICENCALYYWNNNGPLTDGDGTGVIVLNYSILTL